MGADELCRGETRDTRAESVKVKIHKGGMLTSSVY